MPPSAESTRIEISRATGPRRWKRVPSMRCRADRNGNTSRNGTAFAACSSATRQGRAALEIGRTSPRYFPELVDAALKLKATTFLLDGEIVVPHGKAFSFDDLLQRIHPAASRVRKLSQETPALFIAFDLLATARDKKLSAQPLAQTASGAGSFRQSAVQIESTFRLSPATTSFTTAKKWLAQAGGGCDGVIAKRLDLPYQSGNRDGMQKIKNFRSADCVVGGFRYATNKLNGKQVRRLAAARPLR